MQVMVISRIEMDATLEMKTIKYFIFTSRQKEKPTFTARTSDLSTSLLTLASAPWQAR